MQLNSPNTVTSLAAYQGRNGARVVVSTVRKVSEKAIELLSTTP